MAVAVLFGIFTPTTTLRAATRLIVVLYPQNNDGSPGSFLVDQSIRATFAAESTERIEIYNEYLDVAKSSADVDESYHRDYLQKKYAGRKVELVIVGLSTALDYALANRDLFPGAPIVICAVDQTEVRRRDLPSDVVGRPAHFDVRGTLDLAFKLHPQTENVALIAGNSRMDSNWAETATQLIRSHPRHPNLISLVGLSLDDLITRSANLPDKTVIYYLHVFNDSAGHTLVPAHVLESISHRANAPIYGHVDTYVGRGIVGGHVFSFQSQGRHAAQVGLRLLAGTPPEKIGIESVETNEYQVDERQLERWQIDENLLPEACVIRFREETFLQRYKWRIALLTGFCVAQTGLIVGLFFEVARRKRAEQRFQAALADLQSNQRQLRQLSGSLIGAQENERRRVARELHDDFNQMLALLSVELDLIRQKLPSSAPELQPLTDDLAARIRNLSTAIHDLSHELHPLKLEQLGLVTAVRSLCKEIAQSHLLAIDFTSETVPDWIAPEVSLCLYRIVQEALRNVVKHSQATHARVALAGTSTGITLEITDGGIGFDSNLPEYCNGLGLLSIRERLRLVGGELKIDAAPSQGVSLTVVIPSNSNGSEPIERSNLNLPQLVASAATGVT